MISVLLALALFVLGYLTNTKKRTFPTHQFTFITKFFNRSSYLHVRYRSPRTYADCTQTIAETSALVSIRSALISVYK